MAGPHTRIGAILRVATLPRAHEGDEGEEEEEDCVMVGARSGGGSGGGSGSGGGGGSDDISGHMPGDPHGRMAMIGSQDPQPDDDDDGSGGGGVGSKAGSTRYERGLVC